MQKYGFLLEKPLNSALISHLPCKINDFLLILHRFLAYLNIVSEVSQISELICILVESQPYAMIYASIHLCLCVHTSLRYHLLAEVLFDVYASGTVEFCARGSWDKVNGMADVSLVLGLSKGSGMAEAYGENT